MITSLLSKITISISRFLAYPLIPVDYLMILLTSFYESLEIIDFTERKFLKLPYDRLLYLKNM
jgi:hypothetical protein